MYEYLLGMDFVYLIVHNRMPLILDSSMRRLISHLYLLFCVYYNFVSDNRFVLTRFASMIVVNSVLPVPSQQAGLHNLIV